MSLNDCVIDTSALVALFLREPEALEIVSRISASERRLLPPTCMVEFCLLHRLGGDRPKWVAAFIDEYDVAVPLMDASIAWLATNAAIRFGRGSQHPAKLNFGDCISYAFARRFDAPLLFKGDDFRQTDIQSALTGE